MKFSTTLLAAALASVTGYSSLVLAAPEPSTWAELNQSIIHSHVMPRYEQLGTNSLKLSEATQDLCSVDTPAAQKADRLTAAQDAYRNAMDAWQGIQHIQFGPITLLMRNFSLEYWPDKKNTGARQLRQALTMPEPAYDTEFFHAASVSIKGFPALERLLFAPSATTDLTPNSPHCELAVGIAEHINWNVASVHDEWEAEAESMAVVGEEENYESHKDAATAFMKSLVEPLEAIRDNKLLAPLGDTPEETRWKKSESWRSGISIANVRTNIATLHELYSNTSPLNVEDVLADNGQSDLATEIDALFEKAQAQLAPITEPANTVTPKQREQMLAAADTIRALKNNLLDAMQLLDVQLGFNSRDGD